MTTNLQELQRLIPIVDEIFDIAWQSLIDHQHKDVLLGVLPDHPGTEKSGLSWQSERAIPFPDAKAILREWIWQAILRTGKVYLYTCKDNQDISIDSLTQADLDDMEPEDHDLYEYWELKSTEEQILFIFID